MFERSRLGETSKPGTMECALQQHRLTEQQFTKIGAVPLAGTRDRDQSFGGSMAIKFVQTPDGSDDSIRFQPMERLKVYMFGAIVLFASFGMGETVYRLLFSEFDGAKDRIPIEAIFGFAFAWLATKFVGDAYRNRKERRARLNFIWARNHQIRGALEGIMPLAHPARNQQSIRVIREEVDRIEWALKEILPR
jgi:hypothetical protein